MDEIDSETMASTASATAKTAVNIDNNTTANGNNNNGDNIISDVVATGYTNNNNNNNNNVAVVDNNDDDLIMGVVSSQQSSNINYDQQSAAMMMKHQQQALDGDFNNDGGMLINEQQQNTEKMMDQQQQEQQQDDDSLQDDEIPEIELIIRASTIDGRRKGACLFGQEYFMDLYLLAELKTISLKVTTVDMLRPPADFRSKFDSTPPPILIDRGEPILENEKIERYIMKNIPGGHNLFVSDKETLDVLENIYPKFKVMLQKNDEQSKQAFTNHLNKIEKHLAKRNTRYLTGPTLCCFDCELMTRLQHFRVAGKYFVGFEIPESFVYLWRYMYSMYNLDAFKQSCPADQDIINHYKLQQRAKMSKHEELEAPTYTQSIPDSVLEYFGDDL